MTGGVSASMMGADGDDLAPGKDAELIVHSDADGQHNVDDIELTQEEWQ